MVAMVIMVAIVMVVVLNMVVMVDRTGQDRTGQDRTGRNWHLNLTFQVTCDWQFSQFLRCFIHLFFRRRKERTFIGFLHNSS